MASCRCQHSFHYEQLDFKVSSVVMLLRNLSLRQGLCNATRLKVTHMHNNCIQAVILTGASQGNTVLIPGIKLAPSDTNLPFVLERHQLPLRLAYSMTINKAQGQTFEKSICPLLFWCTVKCPSAWTSIYRRRCRVCASAHMLHRRFSLHTLHCVYAEFVVQLMLHRRFSLHTLHCVDAEYVVQLTCCTDVSAYILSSLL